MPPDWPPEASYFVPWLFSGVFQLTSTFPNARSITSAAVPWWPIVRAFPQNWILWWTT